MPVTMKSASSDKPASYLFEVLACELRSVESFPPIYRHDYAANWTVRELRSFTQDELGKLHSTLLWSVYNDPSERHRSMCRKVIERTIKVRLENYEKSNINGVRER